MSEKTYLTLIDRKESAAIGRPFIRRQIPFGTDPGSALSDSFLKREILKMELHNEQTGKPYTDQDLTWSNPFLVLLEYFDLRVDQELLLLDIGRDFGLKTAPRAGSKK